MIGKWQLGFFKEAYLPWKRGFDEFFGQLLGGQDYYNRRKCLKFRVDILVYSTHDLQPKNYAL